MNKRQMRADVKKAIKAHGVEAVRAQVCPQFQKMVAGTRLKKELGLGTIIAIGYDNLDPDNFRFVVGMVLEAMPAGPEKEALRVDVVFWDANEAEIMSDHGVTRAK